MLELHDKWVWDSWYAHDGNQHHAFYLQAPRSLGDPHARHHAASIGHATSPDLASWTPQSDALHPSAEPAWDDQATWTGCVVEGPDQWYLFYTGISRGDDCTEQRIGVATSTDLQQWERLGSEPVLTADARWYETDPANTVDGVAWRDPWVFRADDGRWHMLLTASAAGYDPHQGGVIGHAVSDDLRNWEALPPLTAPGTHRCLEVPQVTVVDEQPVLVYAVPRAETESDPLPLGDTWIAPAASLLGPYDLRTAQRVVDCGLYAGRLVEQAPGQWVLMAFENVREESFAGAISDPVPVNLQELFAAPRTGARR